MISVEHARDWSDRVVIHQFHESDPAGGVLIYVDAEDVPNLVVQLQNSTAAARAHLAGLRYG